MLAGKLIEQAFSDIGKKASQNPLSGDEMQEAIDTLNLMMYSYDRLGLGHTEVTSSSTALTTPAYSWLWMRKKLAQLLAPEYGRLESYIFLDEQEKAAYSAIRIALGRIGPPQLDGRVPIGSGNQSPGAWEDRFYQESDAGILTQTNQDIITEDE